MTRLKKKELGLAWNVVRDWMWLISTEKPWFWLILGQNRGESRIEREWENIRKNFLKSCRGLFAWPLVRRHSCTSLVLPDFRQKQGFGRPLVLCRSREAQKYGWVTGSTPWSRSGHVRSLFYPLFQLLKHFKPEYFQHSKRGILTQNQLNFHIFWKHQIWNT